MITQTPDLSFSELGLASEVFDAVAAGGYDTPTPIQAAAIPHLLSGRDVVGQASTGTGKTAAFALPLLSRVDISDRCTQILVLTPTRELALQVARSFRKYGENFRDLSIQPIYGGTPYSHQIRELKKGVHIVIGTPGRVMDHMNRGTLDLSSLRCLVLDEADEMLRMGFVDDVTWILEQTPAERQTALFSATMPPPIRRIADQHLKDPEQVTIKDSTATAGTINARYVVANARDKVEVLYRILETEDTDGVIVFTKTREATLRIAETLAGHGYLAEALNGDMPQAQRERTVQQLKSGRLNVLVATDVAARGLDVQRISHVINFDMPHDTESYVHRIGRTGRAGRSGETILFATRKDIRRVRMIERETRQNMTEMDIPSARAVNEKRRARFCERVTSQLDSPDLEIFRSLIQDCLQNGQSTAEEVAAAVAAMLQGDRPFLMDEQHDFANGHNQHNQRRTGDNDRNRREQFEHRERRNDRPSHPNDRSPRDNRRSEGFRHNEQVTGSFNDNGDGPPPRSRRSEGPETGMERFRIEVGRDHGVQPGNIVGAIANEAGLNSRDIGRITINEDHSFVDLPEGMPKPLFRQLKDVVVSGRHLRITRTASKGGRKSPFRKQHGGGRPRSSNRPSTERKQRPSHKRRERTA